MEHFQLEWWALFFGGLSTLAIYSFLYRENPFYRFFEHLYIGIATGITTFYTIRNFIWPEVFRPMFGADRVPFPDGTYPEEYQSAYLLYLLPAAFGMLYYCILSRRQSWLAQIAIGFSLGIGGGLAFKATFNELFPQLVDSLRPVYIPGEAGSTLTNMVFIFTLFTALSYFFFTVRQKKGGVMERSALAGRWMMMGCFGAFFGSTIMARMMLLVERLEFLINQWVPALI